MSGVCARENTKSNARPRTLRKLRTHTASGIVLSNDVLPPRIGETRMDGAGDGYAIAMFCGCVNVSQNPQRLW